VLLQPLPAPEALATLPGDLNHDNHVDLVDYSIFLSHFGETTSNNPADFNLDQTVNVLDYNIIVTHYGHQ
jgi:hypothetical protein